MILSLMLATNLAAAPTPAACGNLSSLKLPATTIALAEFRPVGSAPIVGGRGIAAARGQAPAAAPAATAGPRGQGPAQGVPPDGRGQPTPAGRGAVRTTEPLPAYCRVIAVLKPSPDSVINVEVWMPSDTWNGKFQAVGNGGWAGSIQGVVAAMPAMLRAGYATAGTDTGHTGGNGSFSLGHPEKVIDFGYRAIHEMTVQAKAIIKAYYDQSPKYSYFNGCSTGGRQALMEAQRYPEDYDGIIAGAPATNQVHLHAADLSRMMDIYSDPAGFLTPAKQATLANAVLDACDAIDGVKDRIVSRPRQCKFDPAVLLCKNRDNDACLTAAQVRTATRIYASTKNSKGEVLFPGFTLGGESAYAILRGGVQPGSLQLDTFRYLAHQDPNWDWRTFSVDADVELANKNAGFINATDPDLSKFKARGGKLILYHGWADQAIQPENTIRYYESVLAKMGKNQDGWLRLFMAPGMQHCGGGPGPNQFDVVGAMEAWREKGVAPATIPAVNAATQMNRPLCPYPTVPKFQGPLDPTLVEEKEQTDGTLLLVMEAVDNRDASNFLCKTP